MCVRISSFCPFPGLVGTICYYTAAGVRDKSVVGGEGFSHRRGPRKVPALRAEPFPGGGVETLWSGIISAGLRRTGRRKPEVCDYKERETDNGD